MTRFTATIKKVLARPGVITALDAAFSALALGSLGYAVVTAPRNGIDLINYYKEVIEWVAGFSSSNLSVDVYPPFAKPILSPLALFSFEQTRVLWLCMSLFAAVASLCLVLGYFKGWPARAKYYLVLLVLSWAPFRVTLRVGQLSLMITALILGALVARSRKRKYLAGVLLGLSLCKFTLSFPFFLYFIWKKEWKSLAAALALITILTEAYAFRLGLSLVEVVRNYFAVLGKLYASTDSIWVGSTAIKPLLTWLARGDPGIANVLWTVLFIAALIVLVVIFTKRPDAEPVHIAILSLFALWAVYHRTYDSVLYMLPVALLIDLLIRKKHVRFSVFWLAATGLLVVSIPGLLTSRLGISEEALSQSALGFVALHIERILTLGMFVGLLFLLWKDGSPRHESREETGNAVEHGHYASPQDVSLKQPLKWSPREAVLLQMKGVSRMCLRRPA